MNAKDKKLWSEFSKRYFELSRLPTTSTMPGRFVAEIEDLGRKGMLGGCSDSEQGLSSWNCVASINKVEFANTILFQSPLEPGHISAVGFLAHSRSPSNNPFLKSNVNPPLLSPLLFHSRQDERVRPYSIPVRATLIPRAEHLPSPSSFRATWNSHQVDGPSTLSLFHGLPRDGTHVRTDLFAILRGHGL
ncbi:unnamed protein product [Penicillium egyptiacum]|uniref:Uncharacterized protein n=1 Tax=Penicillium egyptiacum TaxID=1303716 RepID=A0A9W4K6R6_9EURO|nr:unnamed protein product [Penicillium egyptiacum]